MQKSSLDLGRSAIVAAHPDDEALWFGSLLPLVERVVLCYGPSLRKTERAAQRRRVLDAYPRKAVVLLDLTQPGLHEWHARPDPGRTAEQEETDLQRLVDGLGPSLQGCTTVFTHNAWGEYGHPDHLRVHAAVNRLRSAIGYQVFTSSYLEVGRIDSAQPALRQHAPEVLSFPVDLSKIQPVVALYQAHGCWTWHADWTWPIDEHFLSFDRPGRPGRGSIPVQLFDMNA